MGLIGSLLSAGRSLEVFTAGIEVAGQNVANANTPGYVREDLKLGTAPPYQKGGLVFGTGVQANGIRQQIDLHLETQIHSANADASGSLARQNGYSQLQLILSELGGRDLSTKLNEFTNSVNELVNQPELITNRQNVIQQGSTLAKSISTTREQLDRVRTGQTTQIDSLVNEANGLIDQISTLNQRIIELESGGLLRSDAGGLRSSRLEAVGRLSEIIPVQVTQSKTGKINLFSGSDYLIIEGTVQHLESVKTTDRGIPTNSIQFGTTQAQFPLGKGELSGLIESRDNVVGGFVDQLDDYAVAIIQQVNQIHASGEGLKGYTDITGSYAVDETNVALNAAGLALTPTHGSFEIKIYDQATEATVSTQINIDLDGIGGNDTTLEDLQTSLDAVTNLNASIDTFGKLKLTTDDGFEVRFSNDNSNTLAALGINTFFTGKDSNDIAVNNIIEGNPELLAVGLGDGPGDNRNAIKLASFMETPLDSLGGKSIDQFYALAVSQIAESASAETALSEGFESFRDSLNGQRQQISGVNVDEEAIKILQYQQSYAAAARIISTIDDLFTTLLNI